MTWISWWDWSVWQFPPFPSSITSSQRLTVFLLCISLQVRISEPSNGSDEEKDEYEESDKDGNSDESQDGDTDSEEEEGGHIDKPVKRFAVTPFLGGVLPAGRLRVKLKPVGSQANGLIQVRLMHLPLCVTLSTWFYLQYNLCISAFTGKW